MPKFKAVHFSEYIKSLKLFDYDYCECCGRFSQSFKLEIVFSSPFSEFMPRIYQVFLDGINEKGFLWFVRGINSAIFFKGVCTDGAGSEKALTFKFKKVLKQCDISGLENQADFPIEG